MMIVLRVLHNTLITVFMVIVYPIVALMSLISMAIGYKEFSHIADWTSIWWESVKRLWSKKRWAS